MPRKRFITNSNYIASLFFLLLFLISNQVANVEAGYVVVQIDVEQKPGGVQLAEVGPGSTGTVHFKGEINLIKYPIKNEQVILQLSASTNIQNDKWGSTVIPPLVLVSPDPRQPTPPVDIFVTAPLYADVKEQRNVVISGTWMVNPGFFEGEIMETGVFVGVKPFIRYAIYPIEGYQRVRPGKEAEYIMGIYNLGNRNESFSVSVFNADGLADAGIVVHFPSETLNVAPMSLGEFPFKVKGTVKEFSFYRSHITAITLMVKPTTVIPGESVGDLEKYVQTFDFFYYEFGPSFPEPCIFMIIISVVALVGLVYYVRKRSAKRKKLRRLMRRRNRQKLREQRQNETN